MKVLLVGNYEPDRQWSMQRFCKMLAQGLREEGVEVEVIRPPVVLGRSGNKWLGYLDKFVLFRFALSRAVNARKGWLVHIIDQGNAIYAGWLRGSKTAVTCHDLLAIRAARGEFPQHPTGWSGKILQRMILRGLHKAGAIVCVSEATRKDVARLVGESAIIANGIEDTWKPMDAAEARKQIEAAGVPAGEYLLHVGGNQWYKNRPAVIRIFIDLRKATPHSPKLVLAGPILDEALNAELKKAGLANEVTVLRDISDESLRALYSMARVLVFPSLEEGFGWPILEAQACGCPVIATAREPMRETGGKSAIYPVESEWVNAVSEVLGMDQPRRAALVAAGIENARRYTAKRMARQYIEFYQSHLAQ